MTSHWQVWLYVAAVFIPLVAFATGVLFRRWLRSWIAWIATGAIFCSFLLSLIGFLGFIPHLKSSHGESSQSDHAQVAIPFAWTADFEWLDIGSRLLPGLESEPVKGSLPALRIPVSIRIDALTVVLFVMVSLIATLIHFYSIAYMAEDPRYSWFFTYLSLFCFSMLALLASDSLFLVFMTWELVGICSYLLIGFWYEEKTNVQAANKAFIVNRIGDFGFLIGLGVLWTSFGTFSISEINRELADPGLRDAHLRLTRPTATHGDPGGLVRLSSRDQVVEGAGPGTCSRRGGRGSSRLCLTRHW